MRIRWIQVRLDFSTTGMCRWSATPSIPFPLVSLHTSNGPVPQPQTVAILDCHHEALAYDEEQSP